MCRWFGHKWRWRTIANKKSAHECVRCRLTQNIQVVAEPPRTPDWWQERKKK
jgi:hypothetical protein